MTVYMNRPYITIYRHGIDSKIIYLDNPEVCVFNRGRMLPKKMEVKQNELTSDMQWLLSKASLLVQASQSPAFFSTEEGKSLLQELQSKDLGAQNQKLFDYFSELASNALAKDAVVAKDTPALDFDTPMDHPIVPDRGDGSNEWEDHVTTHLAWETLDSKEETDTAVAKESGHGHHRLDAYPSLDDALSSDQATDHQGQDTSN
jgi:hypothetical protein